ncbi:MAG: hypothetical protein QM729_03750 [Solirubrobacterales bacterium]
MSTNATSLRDLIAVKDQAAGPEDEGTTSISAETIAYWAVMVGIYLGFGFLWYYASKEKLIDDGFAMPAGLKEAYAGSFVESFPGLDVTWAILGLVEAVAFLGIVGSILTGEFLPARRKPILTAALGVSLLTFGLLIFGQEMIGENEGVASLFGYFGATVVTLLLVRVLPPRRAIWRPAEDPAEG